MQNVKIGNKVECINEDGITDVNLTYGKWYEVIGVDKDDKFIYLTVINDIGISYDYLSFRFRFDIIDARNNIINEILE